MGRGAGRNQAVTPSSRELIFGKSSAQVGRPRKTIEQIKEEVVEAQPKALMRLLATPADAVATAIMIADYLRGKILSGPEYGRQAEITSQRFEIKLGEKAKKGKPFRLQQTMRVCHKAGENVELLFGKSLPVSSVGHEFPCELLSRFMVQALGNKKTEHIFTDGKLATKQRRGDQVEFWVKQKPSRFGPGFDERFLLKRNELEALVYWLDNAR
jgi:hypothetical protein